MIKSIWIIGPSQSGKTTLAKLILDRLRQQGLQSLHVDGDDIRNLREAKLGFDVSSRRKQTTHVMRHAQWIIEQDALPVVAIIHPFEDDRARCRKDLEGYFEVYLKCDMQELIRRDSKKLYLPAMKGEKKHVVGVDIPFDPPQNSDLTLDSGYLMPDQLVAALWSKIVDQLPTPRIF